MAAATSALDKALVFAKWTGISAKQDVLTVNGLWRGLMGAGIQGRYGGRMRIFLATTPDPTKAWNMFKPDGSLTGFGREVQYLQSKGYTYNPATGFMVKP